VLIELFSLGVTLRRYTGKNRLKMAISLERGQFDAKFQVQGVALPPTILFVTELVNGLSCGIRMRAQLSFALSQITRLTDRQTGRILIARTPLHSICSAVITR